MPARLSVCLLFTFLLLAFGWPTSTVQAQANGIGSVSGTVIDGQTKQPLGFATVFIAQTTYGTNSAENGTFKLIGLPPGSHELVVSFLGYETLTHQITLQAGQQLSFRFELMPKANALQEVVIRPDPNWRNNYQVFFKNFIGQTPNAAKTTIVNAEVLKFNFDAKANVLTADASKPLIIESKALGYRLHFLLEDFKADFKTGQVFHMGFPRFEEMKPGSQAQQKRWASARLKAYNGSMMHFLRALHAQNLEAEGFQVRRLQRLPNPHRPPQEEIQAGLKRWRNKSNGTIVLNANATGPEDSLQYWSRMARLDKTVTYLYKEPVPYTNILRPDTAAGRMRVQFPDFLNVVYGREKEEMSFVNQGPLSQRRAPSFQTSLLTLVEPFTYLDPAGMLLNPYSHLVEGYWAWEKLAEMLPLDYQPLTPVK
ncbi:carboxypeptidase-like regulatory domain-containing protein [Rufibacter sp. LB8]|uniref:carboxypeptidase-like regulatory domain-containing protein n=1 Tax=Rufibacter sp. LB8 TaxID=2777781 RepID=UPI00178C350F|nr:carboxypeptidase-like regulatory domain-containing protein [Rufibacter sp. LB8]